MLRIGPYKYKLQVDIVNILLHNKGDKGGRWENILLLRNIVVGSKGGLGGG